MLYSLSPGWDDVNLTRSALPLVNQWRITGDTWDAWPRIANHFSSIAAQQLFIGAQGRYDLPGFPDLDILPLGYIGDEGQCYGPSHQARLSEAKQVTVVTLWMMARSPIQFAGDFTHTSDFVFSLITNSDALYLNANSTNTAHVITNASMAIWRSDDVMWRTTGVSSVSLHNLLDRPTSIAVTVSDMRGQQNGRRCDAVEVWTSVVWPQVAVISVKLDTYGSALYKLLNCTSERTTILAAESR